MLKDTITASKFIVGFIIALVVAIAIGVIGLHSLSKSTAYTADLAFAKMPSTIALQKVVAGQLQVAAGQSGLTIRRMSEPQARQVYFEEVDKGMRRFVEGRRVYELLTQPTEEARLWKQLVPVLEEWQRLAQPFADIQREKDNALAQGQKTDDPHVVQVDGRAFQALLKIHDSPNATEKNLHELVELNNEYRKTVGKEAADSASSSMTLFVMILLLGIGFVVVTPIMDKVVQIGAANAEESASAAEELSSQKATAEEAIPFNDPDFRYF